MTEGLIFDDAIEGIYVNNGFEDGANIELVGLVEMSKGTVTLSTVVNLVGANEFVIDGLRVGIVDGDIVGLLGKAEGVNVRLTDGLKVGLADGLSVGINVGTIVGLLGKAEGVNVRLADGLKVGLADGLSVGINVGAIVGLLGKAEGVNVRLADGLEVGLADGFILVTDGFILGVTEGIAVGEVELHILISFNKIS